MTGLREVAQDRTLYQWFADSAERHAQEPALEVQGHVLSYDELHRTALALACRLVEAHGAVPDRVALLATRTVSAYAGYLAVQRLGAAVVPLNPDYPLKRNTDIAERAGIDAILVDAEHGAAVPDASSGFEPTVLQMPSLPLPAGDLEQGALPPVPTDTSRIAYILFTSGSTGRPKGVPITQRSISASVSYNICCYEAGPGCRMSQVFGLTFDASVFDMFVAWGSGACLVVPSAQDLYTPVDFIVDQRLTHWFSVPSVITMARLMGNMPLGRAVGLRHSLFGAEPVTIQHADLWRQVAPHSRIHNLYGPTEATITCTDYELPADRSMWPETSNHTVPIGRAYPHLEIVLLNEDGLPDGEGELCVRGPQRFDGYLDPAEDMNRFLLFEEGSAPAAPYTGGGLTALHWYRTGDRVAIHGGSLVHRGRLDNQVKIMGHRVEIGEVEAALRQHVDVVEAAVVARSVDGETQLLAAYSGTCIPENRFHHWLRRQIPLHMVPRRIVHLDALPLNGNGKTDRRRLAEILGDHTQPKAPTR
ncbi:AMP-binding protein [Streptomyces sp. NPDC006463]|uniref:AMP-binding protein n=1 Tax=Streptomyces sp. NPDC006463 TaxID=3364746 RepID=UPI0036B81358